VLSARVVTTPLGEVSEVHVLAQSGLSPKQIVRNIESALLAQLGLKIAHRKISVAQTAEVKPLEALDRYAVKERSPQRSAGSPPKLPRPLPTTPFLKRSARPSPHWRLPTAPNSSTSARSRR
jgi:hypothetical protein